jgi:hypothetical protein
MQTTNHAKFGNGIIKDGEDEDVRIWIDVMNEAGGRSILPFAGIIPADAYLWSAYRDDPALMDRLREITQEEYGSPRGTYGTVGSDTVIKSCKIIKDTAIGEGAYIKGANKLKNLTIHSSGVEPAQIGEGVEMVNGIVGYGCHAFYGVKAVRFVMGRNCTLKYGARLIHSVLGDNSTVSCCEILNNLIFPVHEQHHDNSFLIASLIQGMSNMAAGATIGSNHNSRANDGEIRAGRGFWPGLSVTLKHSSRFASFVLIAKGNYPYELNISLPFSLVNNNVQKDRLEVMPAYFWMYNLYALQRNSWKAVNRDKRKHKIQRIEMDYLAPDTAEEIMNALELMEGWMRDAGVAIPSGSVTGSALSVDGQGEEDPEYAYTPRPDDEIPARGLERHDRAAALLKPRRAWFAYREMLRFYGMKTLIARLEEKDGPDFPGLVAEIIAPDPAWDEAVEGSRVREWVNLGGQIAPAFRVDALRQEIREGRHTGRCGSWEAIHAGYDAMATAYPADRLRHGWSILRYLWGEETTGKPHPARDREAFKAEILAALEIQKKVTEEVYRSRAKDFHDPFRGITYRSGAEMEAVAGKAEQNPFVTLNRERLKQFEASVTAILDRL